MAWFYMEVERVETGRLAVLGSDCMVWIDGRLSGWRKQEELRSRYAEWARFADPDGNRYRLAGFAIPRSDGRLRKIGELR